MKELVGEKRKEKKNNKKTEGINEVKKYDNKKNEIHIEKNERKQTKTYNCRKQTPF